MLTGLAHLALEVKYLDRARGFYVERLGLDPARETETELVFDVGETTLVLRRPLFAPRGGLHTHYALSTPSTTYERWNDRFADLDPVEFDFGAYRSLYVDDPDDHCVEVGSVDDEARSAGDGGDGRAAGASGRDAGAEGADASDPPAPPLTGIFEVVLEVVDLGSAEERYRRLGFEPVDRGEDRRRVRLRGPMDLELWEPQLGIADARGGVHVDIGFRTDDPAAAVEAFDACGTVEAIADGYRVRDADGHDVTFVAG